MIDHSDLPQIKKLAGFKIKILKVELHLFFKHDIIEGSELSQ